MPLKLTLLLLFTFISFPIYAQTPPVECHVAIAQITENLQEEDKIELQNTAFEDLIKYHHGWGTNIRNSLNMWGGNTALVRSCISLRDEAELHPDNASMIIIEEIWKTLTSEKK